MNFCTITASVNTPSTEEMAYAQTNDRLSKLYSETENHFENILDYTDSEIQSLNNTIRNNETVINSKIENKVNEVNTRIDNIIAHNNDTENNTELMDIRTGENGVVYNSAGTAIREQLSQLKNSVRDLSDENRMNLLKSMLLHTYTDISLANHASDFRYSYNNRTNALVASNGFSNGIAITPSS